MITKVSAAAIAALFVVAPVSANDVADYCTSFAESNEMSSEPCSCIGELSESNADIADAVLALETKEDVQAIDPAVLEAIQDCLPTE